VAEQALQPENCGLVCPAETSPMPSPEPQPDAAQPEESTSSDTVMASVDGGEDEDGGDDEDED